MWQPTAASLCVRVWLAILAAFELPDIADTLLHPAERGAEAHGSLKCNYPATAGARRVWALMLTLLVLSRLLAVVLPHSRIVALHCGAVHVAEARGGRGRLRPGEPRQEPPLAPGCECKACLNGL